MYTRVLAIGKVKNVKSSETAKGEPMISFGLATSDGMFSVRQFGEEASKVELQNESVVVVEGKLKVYNQQVYILADSIRPLDEEGKEQKENESKSWNNQGHQGYNKRYQ
jgi:DNA polymerase III alpha subunit